MTSVAFETSDFAGKKELFYFPKSNGFDMISVAFIHVTLGPPLSDVLALLVNKKSSGFITIS